MVSPVFSRRKDVACTDKIASWKETDGKFSVAYNTSSAGEGVMTYIAAIPFNAAAHPSVTNAKMARTNYTI